MVRSSYNSGIDEDGKLAGSGINPGGFPICLPAADTAFKLHHFVQNLGDYFGSSRLSSGRRPDFGSELCSHERPHCLNNAAGGRVTGYRNSGTV